MRTALGEERRKADLSPDASDFAAEAGAKVTHNPDGSWEAVVTGAQNIRRAMDMQDGVRAVEIERGQRIRAGERTERVVDGAGRVQAFPEHIVAQVAKKRGWKPKINWGSSRIETGPDGMLFKQFGSRGWIPTGYDAPGILKTWAERDESTGIQRDPDGNAWMKRGAEWERC